MRGAGLERLKIGVDSEELDAFDLGLDHSVDRVDPSTAHADHANHGLAEEALPARARRPVGGRGALGPRECVDRLRPVARSIRHVARYIGRERVAQALLRRSHRWGGLWVSRLAPGRRGRGALRGGRAPRICPRHKLLLLVRQVLARLAEQGRERSLEKALAEVKADYDFVFIDTPPSLGLLTINALTAANKVIVPVQCEYLSMRGLIQLQNTLAMIRENLNPHVDIEGILPTLVDTRTLHAKEAIELLEENFGDRVFASRIRKTIRFAEAPVKGMSVLKYDPDGLAAHAYRQLAKEVLSHANT